MPLLITSPADNAENSTLIKTAKALRWEVFCNSWKVPECLIGMDGAVSGEHLFCETIAEQMNWALSCEPIDYLLSLKEEYICRKLQILSLKEARGIEETKFFKSLMGKIFQSGVYENAKIFLPKIDIFDDYKILVSDPMNFTSQYRFFIRENEIVSSCCYSYKDTSWEKHKINDSAYYSKNRDATISFVSEMLKSNPITRNSAVIDIGRYKKDSYAVIDVKPAYTANIYGCESTASLDVIRKSCVSGAKWSQH